jgi:hypothetical protein
MQSAPIEGFRRTCRGRAIWRRRRGLSSSPIVCGAEWQGEDGYVAEAADPALRELHPAGASQRELVDGRAELHVARERLFGAALEALAGRAPWSRWRSTARRETCRSRFRRPAVSDRDPMGGCHGRGLCTDQARRRAGAAAARGPDRRVVATGSVRPRRGLGQGLRCDVRPDTSGRQLLRRA